MNLKEVKLDDIILPFYIVTGILVALGFFMIFAPLPEVKAEGEDDDEEGTATENASGKTSIFQYPHLLLGVVALFVYVGVETLPMVSIIGFAKAVFGASAQNLDSFSMYVPLGLVLGYIFGVIMIPKFMSQTTALKMFSWIGIVSALCLIFLPGEYGIYMMALIGFCKLIDVACNLAASNC